MEILNKNLDLYSSRYESNIIIGDLNVGVSDRHMNDICNAYNFVGTENSQVYTFSTNIF